MQPATPQAIVFGMFYYGERGSTIKLIELLYFIGKGTKKEHYIRLIQLSAMTGAGVGLNQKQYIIKRMTPVEWVFI